MKRSIGTRALCLLLTAVLCLSLLPMAALAEEGGPAPARLMGEEGEISFVHVDTDTGYQDWDRSFYPLGGSPDYPSEPVPSNVRFDEATHTLTLENYSGPDREVSFWVQDNDFKINLVGSNTIYRLTSGRSLTLTGSGSLTVTGGVSISAHGENAVFTVENTVGFQAGGSAGQPAVMVTGSAADPAVVLKGRPAEGMAGKEQDVVKTITVNKDPAQSYSSREVYLYKQTIGNTIFSGWTERNGYDYTQVEYFGVQGSPGTGTKGNDPTQYDTMTFNLYPLFGNEESGFVWSEYGTQTIWNDGTYAEKYPGVPFDRTETDISYYIPSYEPVLGEGDFWTVIGADGKALSAVTVNPADGEMAAPTLTGYTLPQGKTGAAYRGSVTFTPASGGTLRYVKQSGADWLRVNETTGAVTGTPPEAGAYSLAVVARETAGDRTVSSLPQAFTVKITDPVASVTLKNALNDGLAHTLTLRQGDAVSASYDLGTANRTAGSVFRFPLPAAGTYTAELTAPLTNETFSYGTASFTAGKGEDLTVTLDNSAFTGLQITPLISSGQAVLEWYHGASPAPDKLVSTAASYWKGPEEDLYVRAVPTGSSVLYSTASPLVKADAAAPYLQLTPIPEETVSGTVTREGQPQRWASVSVTVTAPNGASNTWWRTTDYDGQFSIPGVPLAGMDAVMTVSHADINTFTQPVTSGRAANLAIRAETRTGLLDCARLGSLSDYTITAAKGNTALPITKGDARILLEEPGSLKKGDKLTLFFENDQRFGSTTVTLGDTLAAVVQPPQWTYHEWVSFRVSNESELALWGAVYDSEGALFRSVPVNWDSFSDSYPQDAYTLLLTDRTVWALLSEEEGNTLDGTRAALDALRDGLYTTLDFRAEDHTGGSSNRTYNVIAPTEVPVSLDVDRAASGVTLDAEGETVTVRCTVVPNDPTGKQRLDLTVRTNQVSDGGSSTPYVLPGSVYINGRRAGEEVTGTISPNTTAHVGYFDGRYALTVPDVSAYGGWPVTVQWQSGRTVMDLVTASVSARFDGGALRSVGSATLESPAVTLYAPESVGETAFYVSGQAPDGAEVTLYLDGVEASRVRCRTGIFKARMDLGDPFRGEEHTVTAAVTADGQRVSTEPQTVVYEPMAAVLSKVEVSNYLYNDVTLWENGETPDGYYYYLPDRSMHYTLTFDHAASQSAFQGDVMVYVPTNDGEKALKASFQREEDGKGVWVTEDFKPGDNPPTGAYVSYTAAVPDCQLSANDLVKLAATAQEAMDGWAEAVEPENLAKLKTAAAKVGVTLTDNNNADTRQIRLTPDAVEYPIAIEYTSEGMDVTFGSETGVEYTVTTTMKKGQTMDLATEKDIFTRLENGAETLPGEKALYPIAEPCRYQRISMEDGVLTLREVRRAPAENGKTLWNLAVFTPTTYTTTLFNEEGGYLQTVAYARSAAMDLSDAPGTMAERAALMTVIWTAGLEGIESRLSGEPVSVLPKSGDAALQSDGEETARLMAGKTTVQGIPISKDPNIAFYQMLNTTLALNGVKMDYDFNTEGFWYGQVPGSSHTNGKIFGSTGLHTKLKEGGEMILKVNEIKDNAVCTYGPGAVNLALDGLAAAAREYVKGQIEGNYYSNYWNPFGWLTRGELERKCREQTADWDYVDAMLDKMEADGRKVNRSFMPPRPQDLMDAAKDKAKKPPKTPEKKAPEKQPTPTPTPTPTPKPTVQDTTTIRPPRSTPNVSNLGYVNRFSTFTVPDYRKPVIDPSGVVYEGVPSNPVQGVTATICEVGDQGARTPWNAAEYGQVNPYTTDENGFYQWMVPEGKWSVTFDKEGYETYTTGKDDGWGAAQAGGTWYMPVLPAQMDVNINLRRVDAPEVASAVPTKDGVQVTFTQYMDAAALTPARFSLLVNSREIPLSAGSIRLLDGEKVGDRTLVREILIKTALADTDRVSLTVDRAVESYGGKPMAANYVLTDASILPADRAEILSVAPDGAKVAVTASCDSVGGGTVVCAAYQDGRMVTVQSRPVVSGTGQRYDFDLGTTAYRTVRVFILDSGLRPLCPCREVSGG